MNVLERRVDDGMSARSIQAKPSRVLTMHGNVASGSNMQKWSAHARREKRGRQKIELHLGWIMIGS